MNEGTRLALNYAEMKTDVLATALLNHFHDMACDAINKRWGAKNPQFDDMLQEAYMAILEAAEFRFDVDKGTEFSTFVHHRINHAINTEACKGWGVMPIPWSSIKRYRQALRAASGDAEQAEKIAPEYGISSLGFMAVHNVLNPSEMVDVADNPDVAEQVISGVMVETILGNLPPRERQLFSMYHGIEDGQRRTATEMSALNGMTEQEVRNEIARIRRQLLKIARKAYSETDYADR